ncbi:DNA internalization-related competence protein ComEC/Rec2 [Streptococcus didelphis]|uniref:DNA internalization-related competence protein ComEC/Rec2 n=2 Tax=Streptococcus didelphis TaxID=102886 RepID=UPI00035FB42F
MISFVPITLSQLAYLLVLVFYSVFSPSLPIFIIDFIILVRLLIGYDFRKLKQLFCIVACFLVYFSLLKVKQEKDFHHQASTLTRVILVPDTSTINGTSLSFLAKHKDKDYMVFYQLKNKKESDFFRNNTNFLEIEADISLTKAEQRRNFNGFDYRNFLKYQGIYRIGNINKIDKVTIKKADNLLALISQLRRQAIVWCQKNFPQPMSHYMTGLLFGYLDKSFGQMTDLYSQLGIIHLFALSGMQVGFFLNYFRRILIYSGLPQEFIPYCEGIFSLFYAGMTGYSISVIRSLLQRNLANLGLKAPNNFAISLICMFFINPYFLLSIGGVLSFTYAFILSILNYNDLKAGKKIIVESLTLSLAILPILLFFFSTFNPAAILLTAIFSFLFDVLILPLLSLVFMISPLVKLGFFNKIFIIMESLIHFIGHYLSRPIIFGKPSLLLVIVLIILLAITYDYRKNKKIVIPLLFLTTLLFYLPRIALTNEVTILDVGQGDSIFIRDLYNRTILIDVGGKHYHQGKQVWQKRHIIKNAQRTLIPYLKSQGIVKIDHLILTHTDTDHVGDMEEVIETFKVKEILISQGSLSNQKFVKRLNKMAIKTKTITCDYQLPIMDSHLQVLYPWKKGDGKNNDSLVLYGKLLNKRFLFTGDLESDGEKAILEKYPNLKVDILKVGHHGSKTSSSQAFLEQITPKLSLISAGKDNPFKHPHKETLERLKKVKTKIYRTDQDGAIRLKGWSKWQIEKSHSN